MSAYRMPWSPELTTFAAKSYHGHRGVPPNMDDIISALEGWRQKKAAEKGRKLLVEDREMRREGLGGAGGDVVDISEVDPQKLKGLTVRKDFDGFGICKGIIRSVDDETGTDRIIFRVEYEDGDVEDMYLSEIVNYLRPDEVVLHVQ